MCARECFSGPSESVWLFSEQMLCCRCSPEDPVRCKAHLAQRAALPLERGNINYYSIVQEKEL